jgi:hypothetical protein
MGPECSADEAGISGAVNRRPRTKNGTPRLRYLFVLLGTKYSSNEWNVQLEGTRGRRTSARMTANEEWDSSFALSLRSVGNEVLYTADQMIQRSDTLYSRRAITTRANTMTTTVHSLVHSNN